MTDLNDKIEETWATNLLWAAITDIEQIVADLQRRVYQLEQLEHRIDDCK